jgi:hypothetical protein
MTSLQVFDKPMCCSTGICGPQVDPVLPKFASDLAWLHEQGISVERFNLAQQPQAFVALPDVMEALKAGPEIALPLIRVNDRIVASGIYPTRQQMASWCGVSLLTSLGVTEPAGGSCGPTGCC